MKVVFAAHEIRGHIGRVEEGTNEAQIVLHHNAVNELTGIPAISFWRMTTSQLSGMNE